MGRIRARLRRWVLGRPDGRRARLWALLVALARPAASAPEPDAGPVTSAPVVDPPAAAGGEGGVRRPMVDVLVASALPEGGLKEVVVDGRPLVLARAGGQVFAAVDLCPHAGGPLSEGELEGAHIVCPWHGWRFDLSDGSCEVDPDTCLERVEVEERDSRIWVEAAPST